MRKDKKNIIGKNIKVAREAKRLSQRELARELGVSYQQLSQWENGEIKPQVDTLKMIAQKLNTTLDNLVIENAVFEIKEDKDNIIGRNIRAAREAAGLTQRQLAEKLGMGYQQLNKYELGRREPGFKILKRIAEALNVPTDQLTEGILSILKSKTRFEIISAEEKQKREMQKRLIKEVIEEILPEIIATQLAKDPRLRIIDDRIEECVRYVRWILAERFPEGIVVLKEDIEQIKPPVGLTYKQCERWKKNLEYVKRWARSKKAFVVPPQIIRRFCLEYNQTKYEQRVENVATALKLYLIENKEIQVPE